MISGSYRVLTARVPICPPICRFQALAFRAIAQRCWLAHERSTTGPRSTSDGDPIVVICHRAGTACAFEGAPLLEVPMMSMKTQLRAAAALAALATLTLGASPAAAMYWGGM